MKKTILALGLVTAGLASAQNASMNNMLKVGINGGLSVPAENADRANRLGAVSASGGQGASAPAAGAAVAAVDAADAGGVAAGSALRAAVLERVRTPRLAAGGGAARRSLRQYANQEFRGRDGVRAGRRGGAG